MALTAIHPGEHLAEELKALNMSAAELARKINVPTNRVTQILNGTRAITGDTALRLAHFFGTSAEFWLNLQSLYELRLAQKKAGKSIQALPRLDLEHFRLHVLIDLAAQAKLLECVNLIAQPGRFFELCGRARLGHRPLHFLEQLPLLAFQHQTQAADLLAVVFAADAEVARRRALPDAVQEARAKPAPARIVFLDVERASAELEDPLQNLEGGPQALGAGERAIQFDAAPPRVARELDARIILAHANLQIREGLVVAQPDVEAWLNVFDESGFHQQGVDLGVRFDIIDVGDHLHQVACTLVLRGRLGEIMAGPVAQILRFADIEHPALLVLHQVDAGRGGELLDLFRWGKLDLLGHEGLPSRTDLQSVPPFTERIANPSYVVSSFFSLIDVPNWHEPVPQELPFIRENKNTHRPTMPTIARIGPI
ncbi:MAG: HigA family addiction module antidote protein [Planctomycetes bacterium]|nr:HigA family addiction module antidote protein [Planctomycetota bacterium]